jgi:hypothetical protein
VAEGDVDPGASRLILDRRLHAAALEPRRLPFHQMIKMTTTAQPRAAVVEVP